MFGRMSRTALLQVSLCWYQALELNCLASVEQLFAFFYSLPESSKPLGLQPAPLGHELSSPLSLAAEITSTSSRPSIPGPFTNGWGAFNPRTEFARQGLGSRTKSWRFTDINKDYSFSPTYPNKLVVPSRISDSTLTYAGKYRSKGRIPALTYLHWANHVRETFKGFD